MTTKKEEALRVRISRELKESVEAIAAREDLPMSEIGRKALKEFVERDSKGRVRGKKNRE